jgi:hypothetical protein
MALLSLMPSVTYSVVYGYGVLLDTETLRWFRMNRVATLMLDTLREASNFEQAVDELTQKIDADPDVLKQSVLALVDDLDARRLVIRHAGLLNLMSEYDGTTP